MIRVFITNVIEGPDVNKCLVIDELSGVTDTDAVQSHFIAPRLSNGRFSRSTIITVAYSPSGVLDSISNPLIDKLPPQQGNRSIPTLPTQARADFDNIMAKHGFDSGDFGVDFVTTVENMVKRLDPKNSLGELKSADPLEWN